MTAYELRISDWSSDVCSSDLRYVYHVFRRGILVLVRKQRMLKKTAHQHTRIAGKRFFSSIAMMNIEIDNRHALEAVLFKGIGRSNGNIVKKTKDRKSVM